MDNKEDDGVTLRVFLSWSGEASHAFASILHDWLPTVLHVVDPWMSSKDIAKGKRWDAEIGDNLEQARYCIVCVTPGVECEPWVNFEAGAVSKIVKDSYVSPLLVGVSVSDLGGLPLSLFQCRWRDRRCPRPDWLTAWTSPGLACRTRFVESPWTTMILSVSTQMRPRAQTNRCPCSRRFVITWMMSRSGPSVRETTDAMAIIIIKCIPKSP